MTFVWIVGNFSKWNHNELRYSIRSVLKFHPDADIWVCGYKPSWYKGNHIPVADPDKCPYINVWNKIETVCRHPDIPDIFVQMDDDFFLMQPFSEKHYFKGRMFDYYHSVGKGAGNWSRAVKATFDLLPNAQRHCLHVPLAILKDSFLRIAQEYPERQKPPSLVPRQIYCANETAFDLVALPKDVKFIGGLNLDRLNRLPFFSTHDNAGRLMYILEQLYPEPSIHEK